ncbi:DUF4405 domain-containing protein [bacterium]|nr:DUF4405 domain-containing protein [bacterium]
MSVLPKLRSFATPLTIGGFVLSAVTGVALFFHFNTPGSKALHEWFGWLLIGGVALHVWLNRKVFATYFRQPLALVIIALLVGLTAFSFFTGGGGGGRGNGPGGGGERRGPSGRLATEVIMGASVSVAAQLAKSEPEQLIAKLEAAGIEVESKDQTLSDIASDADKNPGELIELVFR